MLPYEATTTATWEVTFMHSSDSYLQYSNSSSAINYRIVFTISAPPPPDIFLYKKHLKMLGPFATASRRTPPVLILHCHSPGVATVATTTKMSRSQLIAQAACDSSDTW